jgi:hypothetical protein
MRIRRPAPRSPDGAREKRTWPIQRDIDQTRSTRSEFVARMFALGCSVDEHHLDASRCDATSRGHRTRSDVSSNAVMATKGASHRLSARIGATTSRQIRELRLCDVFQSVNLSTAHVQNSAFFITSNQVLQEVAVEGLVELCLMKNTFQYSHLAFGVLYTDCRGSGRGLSRRVRLIFCCAALPQIN